MNGQLLYENRHFVAWIDPREQVIVETKTPPLHDNSPAFAAFLCELHFSYTQRSQSAQTLREFVVVDESVNSSRGFLLCGCEVDHVHPPVIAQDRTSIRLLIPSRVRHRSCGLGVLDAVKRIRDEERLLSGISELGKTKVTLQPNENTLEQQDEARPERPPSFCDDRNLDAICTDTEKVIESIEKVLQISKRQGHLSGETPSAGALYARRGLLCQVNDETTTQMIPIVSKNECNTKSPVTSFSTREFNFSLRNQPHFSSCRLYFVPIFDLGPYCSRYGVRAQRFIHLENGALLQQVSTHLCTLGFSTRWLGGFDDAVLAHLLGLTDTEMVSCILGIK